MDGVDVDALGDTGREHRQEVIESDGFTVLLGRCRTRRPTSPSPWNAPGPNPSITKGKAVPSFRPPSPVRAKHSRSRSPGW